MKRKILLVFVCLLSVFLFSCKCSKCSKMTSDMIKEQYKYFDVTLNINNEKYQVIKTSNGILYYNNSKNVKIYYDNINNKYYEINDDIKSKKELNENYSLDKYVNNVYYILTYHTTKNSLKNYDVEKSTYLDQEINIYINENSKIKEEIYVSKKLNICYAFYLKTSEKEINAKIESIDTNEKDLSKYNDYQTIVNDLTTIKEQYKLFNATINFNGNEYQFIKSSDGYYYENKKLNISLYYDFETNMYYTVDNKSMTKTIIEGEYSMDTYVDNIYYILSYHLNKNLILDYNVEDSKYIDRDVKKYTQNIGYSETIIIDKETDACLSFEVSSDKSTVSGKISKLYLEDYDLSYLNDYQTLKQCLDLDLPTKEEIIENFKYYTIVLTQSSNRIQVVKTADGFLCLLTENNETTGVLYDASNNIWYTINESVKEKSVATKEYTVEEYEKAIFEYLTNYLDLITDKFFMLENQKHQDRDVTIYVKNDAVKDTLYKQEFIIDNATGACLKQNISINAIETYFVVDVLSFEGDITPYLEYNEAYYSWPLNHEYLEGIAEIEYGNFVKGFEDEDGLNLYYNNINQSFLNQILKDMKSYGFVKNAEENKILDANQNYTFYTYDALNDKGMKIRLEFDGEQKTLLIILDK